MIYIELMGQPGAGKSSVYNRLLDEEDYLGAISQEVVRRSVLNKAGPLSRLVYRILPEKVRSYLQFDLFSFKFRYRALEKFLRQNPGLLRVIANNIDLVTDDLEGFTLAFKYNAEWYQLGKETIKNKENLCLDEGFAHMAVALLRRSRGAAFPLDQYIQSTPTPDVLIHIDVPPEVALQRQQQRGRVPAETAWETGSPYEVQQRLRDHSLRVKDRYATTTEVLTIENICSLDQTVTEVTKGVEGALSERR